jgi:penicillin amidase
MRGVLATSLVLTVSVAFCSFFYLSQTSFRNRLVSKHLGDTVDIFTDDWGVPHVQAHSYEDALFALGLLHGRDRLWQVDLFRRLSTGRLSGLFGEVTVETDAFFKTLGLHRHAEKNVKALTRRQKKLMEMYARGVNLAAASMTFLPLEYYITWADWEEWVITDSIALNAYTSFMLSSGWGKEVLRSLFGDIVGVEAAQVLLPYDLENLRPPTYILSEEDLPLSLKVKAEKPTDTERTKTERATYEAVKEMTHEYTDEGMASNSWVISGNLTESGRPLIANDPHLASLIPTFFYLVDIEILGSNRLIGATIPGMHSLTIGRNKDMSWTVTSSKGDSLDLFVETRNPENPSQYLYDGRWLDIQTVEEVIVVNGGVNVTVLVELTQHGPLLPSNKTITSAANPYLPAHPLGQDLALRWTVLEAEDVSLALFVDLAIADNVAEALTGLRRVTCPAASIVFATVRPR